MDTCGTFHSKETKFIPFIADSVGVQFPRICSYIYNGLSILIMRLYMHTAVEYWYNHLGNKDAIKM